MSAADPPSDELRAAFCRGRDAFPDLALPEATFERHLATAAAGAGVTSIAALAIEDLYLACACVTGTPGAAAAFSARHGSTIRAAIARVVRGADAAEIEQRFV